MKKIDDLEIGDLCVFNYENSGLKDNDRICLILGKWNGHENLFTVFLIKEQKTFSPVLRSETKLYGFDD